MESNELLKTATYAGRLLLESGAEAYRSEETMIKICESFGVEDAQAFVTSTGLMMSITRNQKVYTSIVRINKRGVDLQKIHLINHLSRNIGNDNMSIQQVYQSLQDIEKQQRYSYRTTLFFSALSAFGFALFFQGSVYDAIAAFGIGMIIKIVFLWMEKNQINDFFNHAISGGIGALCALVVNSLHWVNHYDIVIISSIMLLVPGLAITNAIRDTVAKDYLSGLTRAAEAFLIAVAIATGIAAVFSMWISIGGGM